MASEIFLNPGFLPFLALLAIPLAIHVWLRWRPRTIRWPAMILLESSHRQRRQWITLETLVLLAARCGLVAGVVLLVARPRWGDDWSGLLAGGALHHVIVVDDSASMQQREGDASPHDRATRWIVDFTGALASRSREARVALVRMSDTPMIAATWEEVDAQTPQRFARGLDEPGYSAADPRSAIASIRSLPQSSPESPIHVHVVSDFQSRQWSANSPVVEDVRALAQQGATVTLVQVASLTESTNLGIESLSVPNSAMGVPFAVDVRVRNFADREATNVAVALDVGGRELPAKILETIDPGELAAARFFATADQPGDLAIQARLDVDDFLPDNRRFAVAAIAPEWPVLIVDSSPTGEAPFVEWALAPDARTRTGWSPEPRSREALLSTPLDRYRVVVLLDIPDASDARSALETYVAKGGGLVVFTGPGTTPQAFAELLGSGSAPLVPIDLTSVLEHKTARQSAADLQTSFHPVFRVFQGDRNPFLESVHIDRSWEYRDQVAGGKVIEVIARRREGTPLALERRLGSGRVVVFLTSAGPTWNDWVRNPSYVVMWHELAKYVGEPLEAAGDWRIRDAWAASWDADAFQRRFEVTVPAIEKAPSLQQTLDASLEGTRYQARFSDTVRPGVYDWRRWRLDNAPQIERRAFNVDPAEGDLRSVPRDELARMLADSGVRVRSAGDVNPEPGSRQEARDLVLALLAALLLLEQLLAWRCSHHPR